MFILKKLDDGRVIKSELSDLTRAEVISVANQFLREDNPQSEKTGHYLMQYQRKNLHDNKPLSAA